MPKYLIITNRKQAVNRFRDNLPDTLSQWDVIDQAAVRWSDQTFFTPYRLVIAQGELFSRIARVVPSKAMEFVYSDADYLEGLLLAAQYEGRLCYLGSASTVKAVSKMARLMGIELECEKIDHERNNQIEQVRHKFNVILTDSIYLFGAEDMGINVLQVNFSPLTIETIVREVEQTQRLLDQDSLEDGILQQTERQAHQEFLIFSEAGQLLFSSGLEKHGQFRRTAARIIVRLRDDSLYRATHIIDGEYVFVQGEHVGYAGETYFVFTLTPKLVSGETRIGSGFYIKRGDLLAKDIDNLFYDTKQSQELRRRLLRLGSESKPVVIIGEGGTGKSRLAEYMAQYSPCDNSVLYVVDCKRFDKTELDRVFNDQDSLLYNNNVTVYFKEINLLTDNLLFELLSFLENSTFLKNNKVIFSLTQEYDTPDTYLSAQLINKLECLTIYLLPLRKRSTDIGNLLVLYLNQQRQKDSYSDERPLRFSPTALELLRGYSWPENIKQLKRIIRRLYLTANESVISASEVTAALKTENTVFRFRPDSAVQKSFQATKLKDIEYQAVLECLNRNQMNQTKTAKILGISRSTLWRILNR